MRRRKACDACHSRKVRSAYQDSRISQVLISLFRSNVISPYQNAIGVSIVRYHARLWGRSEEEMAP
jgi:hypothetical protein